ncbi:hypothetical protein [Patulibacter minatonensis]|uniref:hypothetical protein n=1 Tax=Patulibacter minatonensis TaxID=298163 RepID=UPI00047EB3D5|nr:hypothetical protein [Patulibacter minatonensis]
MPPAASPRASGRDLDDLPFFRALSAWKLAVIYAGVVARFRAGPEDANADPDLFEPVIDALAAEADELSASLA